MLGYHCDVLFIAELQHSANLRDMQQQLLHIVLRGV